MFKWVEEFMLKHFENAMARSYHRVYLEKERLRKEKLVEAIKAIFLDNMNQKVAAYKGDHSSIIADLLAEDEKPLGTTLLELQNLENDLKTRGLKTDAKEINKVTEKVKLMRDKVSANKNHAQEEQKKKVAAWYKGRAEDGFVSPDRSSSLRYTGNVFGNLWKDKNLLEALDIKFEKMKKETNSRKG